VVKKGTHIRAGEIWGGVPAKYLSGGEASTDRSEGDDPVS
jgi:hypothetical protein